MSRRKFGRKWWLGLRQRKYAQNRELHRYEEGIVIALLRKRGSGSASQWCHDEPGRWRSRQLSKTFVRLREQGLAEDTRTRSAWLHGRSSTVYRPTKDPWRTVVAA